MCSIVGRFGRKLYLKVTKLKLDVEYFDKSLEMNLVMLN